MPTPAYSVPIPPNIPSIPLEEAARALCWMDGYVTCMAVTPKKIAAETWIVEAMQEDPLHPLPADQAAFLRERITTAYESIVRRLAAHPPRYKVCFQAGDPEQSRQWAKGFTYAMHSFPEAWRHLSRKALDMIYITPIFILRAEDEDRLALLRAKQRENYEQFVTEAANVIPQCIVGLRKSAMKMRGMPASALAKPGRNDPCSCGSGKKYKKCCGR
jgi:uncharacterized protein